MFILLANCGMSLVLVMGYCNESVVFVLGFDIWYELMSPVDTCMPLLCGRTGYLMVGKGMPLVEVSLII